MDFFVTDFKSNKTRADSVKYIIVRIVRICFSCCSYALIFVYSIFIKIVIHIQYIVCRGRLPTSTIPQSEKGTMEIR